MGMSWAFESILKNKKKKTSYKNIRVQAREVHPPLGWGNSLKIDSKH